MSRKDKRTGQHKGNDQSEDTPKFVAHIIIVLPNNGTLSFGTTAVDTREQVFEWLNARAKEWHEGGKTDNPDWCLDPPSMRRDETGRGIDLPAEVNDDNMILSANDYNNEFIATYSVP